MTQPITLPVTPRPQVGYFAVGLKTPRETRHTTAYEVLKLLDESALRCSKLEVIQSFTIGTKAFLRFRCDADISPIAGKLLSLGRGVITFNEFTNEFRIVLPSGKTAPYSSTSMLTVSDGTCLTFVGNRNPNWRAQFEAGYVPSA